MFLEKNLAMLAKRYPQYVDMIRNAPLTGRYVTRKSAATALNLIDKQFNAMFYSNVDPMMGVEKEIKERKIKLPNIGVFIGFGMGYHMIAYHKMFAPIDLIVIFERDPEVFKVAFTDMDYGNVFHDPRILLCLGQEPVQYYPVLFQTLQIGNAKIFMQSMNFIEVGTAIIAHKEYYTNCVRTIKDAVTNVMHLYGNDPKDSLIGIQNTFYNIDVIIESAGIKDLKNAFKGKPGVVVSTGPSLNKNIHLLNEIGDKAVLAAADASLAVMKKHGYKPHFVTSLERVIETAKLFEGLSEEDVKDVYFAACPVVRPETYKNFPGKKVIVYRNFATFKWLEIDRGILDIGPSAGNMAYKILEYMGCNPIILIGQDLAYDGDVSHAEGTTYGDQQTAHLPDIFVEGNYVPKIRTTHVWEMFKKFYEQDVAKSGIKVINATEGGAKIQGTELMTFREAIDQYIKKPINVLQTINKKLMPPFKAQQARDYANVRKKVVDAIEYCQYVLDSYQTALNVYKDFDENVFTVWTEDTPEILEKANKSLAEMERSLKIFSEEKFFLILMHYVQSYFIKSMLALNAIKAQDLPQKDYTNRIMRHLASSYLTLGDLVSTMKHEFDLLLKHLDEKKDNI